MKRKVSRVEARIIMNAAKELRKVKLEADKALKSELCDVIEHVTVDPISNETPVIDSKKSLIFRIVDVIKGWVF